MRRLLTLVIPLLLAACGGPAAPAPAAPPAPTVPTIGELLAAPAPGPVEAVGYLFSSPGGALLVEALRLAGAGAPAPLDSAGIWLGEAPPLPPDALTRAGEVSYAVVAAAGRLEGPGQYGPGGRYSYSLAEPVIEARPPRDLTIPLLLGNSALYEGQAVRVRGQLLASPGTALLIESLGPGGVPDASALQVKLAAIPADPALATLQRSGDGRVTYGPVEVVGVWRAGRLYPLSIVPG
ncbi:MAG TPA: hypothetical protein PKD53_15130 [Chloroflexaceae bacterium]|nr:hypothetical protein [Chloroflexaceae bacterium]